jgi:L-threonylcarbamoyladenylate synthase
VPRADLEAALGTKLRDRDADAPRASGTLAAHYAPRAPLSLVDRAELVGRVAGATDVAVLALMAPPTGSTCARWIVAAADPQRYGHDLYANLRLLDATGAARILVEAPPQALEWEAVNDRLARAEAGGGTLDDEP